MTEKSGSPYLEDEYCFADEAIRFTGLDECIIGVDQRGYLVYCYKKMLEHFMKEMTFLVQLELMLLLLQMGELYHQNGMAHLEII